MCRMSTFVYDGHTHYMIERVTSQPFLNKTGKTIDTMPKIVDVESLQK